TLAGSARGTLFTVAGTGSGIFNRIEAELAGYYLLGVESDSRDRDGKPHPVRVDVPRRGAIVRARRQLVTASAASRPVSGRAGIAPPDVGAAAARRDLLAAGTRGYENSGAHSRGCRR